MSNETADTCSLGNPPHLEYIGVYSEYLKRADINIKEKRFFEALAICSICLDVLLWDIVDYMSSKGIYLSPIVPLSLAEIFLTDIEFTKVPNYKFKKLKNQCLTAGKLIKELKFEEEIKNELESLNDLRIRVVHPIKNKKGEGILLQVATREDAVDFYYRLSEIIDKLGGQSYEKAKKVRASYVEWHRSQRSFY